MNFVDDKVVVPSGVREWVLHASHFGHSCGTKFLAEPSLFMYPGIRDNIPDKMKICTACMNAGKNLKTILPNIEESRITDAKEPGDELKRFWWRNLQREKNGNSQDLVAVGHPTKCPSQTLKKLPKEK